MKSKASLFLMEQLVMLLVFALAAALCLGIFVRADRISVETRRRDEAVLLAGSAAELLKHSGDTGKAQALAQGSGFTLQITEEDPGVPQMRQVRICVLCDGSEVFSLQTGWQEVTP